MPRDLQQRRCEQLFELLASFGFTYTTTTYRTPKQWDGENMILRAESFEGLCHELAHFQVSSPARRKLVGFGLGSEPEARSHVVTPLHYKIALREEGRASLLGIYWVHHLGADWEDNLFDHNWCRESFTKGIDGESFHGAVKWLTKHRFIKAGYPVRGTQRRFGDHHKHFQKSNGLNL